jgi:hypothetical protein
MHHVPAQSCSLERLAHDVDVAIATGSYHLYLYQQLCVHLSQPQTYNRAVLMFRSRHNMTV